MYNKYQQISLVLLRLVVGAVFLNAGIAKFAMWSAAPAGMPQWMVYLMQFLSIVEPIGAVAVIAGFLTRWASAGLAIIMVGAIFFLKFLMNAPLFTGQAIGLDYVILILCSCIALIAFGGGKWTVDAKWMKRS